MSLSHASSKTEERIQLWRQEAIQGVEEREDTVLDLFFSCQCSLSTVIQQGDVNRSVKRDANALQRCYDVLLLWANQHGANDGSLLVTLEQSAGLRQAILEFLIPLCKILLRGRCAPSLSKSTADGEQG